MNGESLVLPVKQLGDVGRDFASDYFKSLQEQDSNRDGDQLMGLVIMGNMPLGTGLVPTIGFGISHFGKQSAGMHITSVSSVPELNRALSDELRNEWQLRDDQKADPKESASPKLEPTDVPGQPTWRSRKITLSSDMWTFPCWKWMTVAKRTPFSLMACLPEDGTFVNRETGGKTLRELREADEIQGVHSKWQSGVLVLRTARSLTDPDVQEPIPLQTRRFFETAVAADPMQLPDFHALCRLACDLTPAQMQRFLEEMQLSSMAETARWRHLLSLGAGKTPLAERLLRGEEIPLNDSRLLTAIQSDCNTKHQTRFDLTFGEPTKLPELLAKGGGNVATIQFSVTNLSEKTRLYRIRLQKDKERDDFFTQTLERPEKPEEKPAE